MTLSVEKRERVPRDASAIDNDIVGSDRRFRLAVEGVQTYGIFMLNPQGEVVTWNLGAERIKGYTAAEIIGKNFSCFYTQEDIDQGKPQETLRLVSEQGRAEVQQYRVRKDGTRFLANLVITALRDQNGKLIGFSEISRDMTERVISEAKYRRLLEAAPDAMVVVNQDGKIVLLNVQAEKQFGYRRDELLGQHVTTIIPEGFAERLLADALRPAAEALEQQIGTGIELIGRRKDGGAFPIEIMLSPHESEEGILVTAAIRDITVRLMSEAKYRRLLEAAPDAMVVVNQDGKIVLLNVQAEKQFGYRRDELLGQRVTTIIPEGFAERLLADALRPAAEALEQQIGTGIELIGRRKDGGAFPIEIMLSPHEGEEGILVTAAIRDITVRRDAEKHLLQMTQDLSLKHRLLNSVVEGTSDPIYIRDVEDRFVLANSACAKLFHRSENDMAGIRLCDLMPDSTYRVVADSDWQIILTGTTRSVEEIAKIDGVEHIFLTTKSPYRDAENKTIGTIGIARDITELRRLDAARLEALTHDLRVRKTAEAHLANTVAELKRSNDELEHFAYIASHDLQEPLRMVASYTQLLAERYKGRLDADADDFIAFAVDGASRMQQLIMDLLAYSRAGADVGEFHTISSERALQVALANLHAAIAESGARVTHDALPEITMDERQLTQILQNLVGNAIKYRGAEPPRVHVSCITSDSSEWTFSVRDNGLGIESQYFEKIFVLFQRLHRREDFEGTGIGLSICKKLLDRIGGRVWVESQPQEGSTFRFSIPKGVRE
jgi:PAS domain S-box-containing protein